MSERSIQLPCLPGREHAEADRERHGDEEGRQRERQRRLDALADELHHRLVREDRDAEIALHDGGGPAQELHRQRIVEAEALADAGDLLRARVVAGDDRRRIAGREMQQQEHEHADDAP